MSDEQDFTVPPIPTLLAVATPPHVLYVPWPLWMVNLCLFLTIGSLAGAVVGGGLRMEFALPVVLPLQAYFAIRYRRDPHIWGVWRARFTARPVSAFVGRRHRFGLAGRIRYSP